ncbi:MAG TPA: hypothetical protein VN247_03425 [Arenimonas sp.]|jgi:hypothetical protein|nr:hypothetical protein [Arenimonas sp.]
MTSSALALLGLMIAGFLLFKIIGFIAKFTIVIVALCVGYWYLAPQFSWPLPF